jgi:small subunit ribosomal protein S13
LSYRILSVSLPDNKAISIALTAIYGIGRKVSLKICSSLKIDPNKRTKDFDESTIEKIRDLIKSENMLLEGDLRRKVSSDIKRLKDIGCYRGIRHVKKLPVRGQRTSTNARTRKGKGVAIAGKKK